MCPAAPGKATAGPCAGPGDSSLQALAAYELALVATRRGAAPGAVQEVPLRQQLPPGSTGQELPRTPPPGDRCTHRRGDRGRPLPVGGRPRTSRAARRAAADCADGADAVAVHWNRGCTRRHADASGTTRSSSRQITSCDVWLVGGAFTFGIDPRASAQIRGPLRRAPGPSTGPEHRGPRGDPRRRSAGHRVLGRRHGVGEAAPCTSERCSCTTTQRPSRRANTAVHAPPTTCGWPRGLRCGMR